MGLEINDNEVQELLEEKRHEEVIATLKNVVKALNDASTSNDDKEVIAAINKQGENMRLLTEKLSQRPEIKVEVDNEKILSSVSGISAEIVKSNNEVINACAAVVESNKSIQIALENRLLPDTFTLNRGYGGVTESVKVNYKPAKEIKAK